MTRTAISPRFAISTRRIVIGRQSSVISADNRRQMTDDVSSAPNLRTELKRLKGLTQPAGVGSRAAVDRRCSDRPRFMLVDRLAQRGKHEVLGWHPIRLPFFPAHPDERPFVPFDAALVGRPLECHTRAHRTRLPQ